MVHYQTTKLSYFTNTKDKTPFLSQSSVIYKFVCPGCKSCYVGKTDRTLHERTKEHAYAKGNKNEQSAIYEHLSLRTHYSHIADLFKIDTNGFNSYQFDVSQIEDNTIILDRGNNWNLLLFKEALMTNVKLRLKPLKSYSCFDYILMILFGILFILLISN